MPCEDGSSPVRNVGHTAPLPIVDGEHTSNHLPVASNDRSAGNSSCSIICRTSVDSAASIPIASILVFTQQLLRIDGSAFSSGSHTRLEDSNCLQVVAAAQFRCFAVTHRAFKLVQQNSFFSLFSRTSSHETRQFAVFPKYQPAVKHMQRRT